MSRSLGGVKRRNPWIPATVIFATLWVVTYFEAYDWCNLAAAC
jgi:hypothetical protein